tara:strand:+ start:8234 stop:8467 length:234 start_codon:yes stop_codon:yes gene_type:complete
MVTKCIGDVIKKRRLGATAKLFDLVSEPVVGQARIKTLETLQECIRREMTARRRALKTNSADGLANCRKSRTGSRSE